MGKALLLVLSRPTGPDTEDDFNNWYDKVHLGEVTGLVGPITAASRYDFQDPLDRTTRTVDGTGGELSGPFGYPYAAVYEIDSEDPESVVQEVLTLAGGGQFDMSDSLDRETVQPVLLLLHPRDASSALSHHD